ncbi:MAG: glycosyltransferase [Akkermansiaceae bacterium]|nr:glycosyltransferase [Akkermansiaceae bacterium]
MKFSIITICYNPGEVVASAVESVLGQGYLDVEYIIVDGGSTDGSLDYLTKISREDARVTLVSEPDEGLYDALNKGVRLATGDVIGFVHADDFLAHADVIKHVAERFEDEATEAVYGDLQYVAQGSPSGDSGWRMADGGSSDSRVSSEADSPSERNESAIHHQSLVIRHWRSGEYSRGKLKWGWMPPHPTLYLKRSVYDRAVLPNGEYFDTSFTCAADYDFMMRVFSTLHVSPVYLSEVMVKMRVGGVSNRSLKHILRKSAEDWRAIRRNKIGHLHTLVWKNLCKVPQFFRRWRRNDGGWRLRK